MRISDWSSDVCSSDLIAGRFFKVVEAGKIEASELGSFAAMKPTNLQPGSLEHALLKDVLLGVNDPRGLTAQMRRSTLRMLLEITDTFGSVPRAEAVKWHWFENVPARDSAERQDRKSTRLNSSH